MTKLRVLYLNPFSQEVSGPDESLLALLGALVGMGVEAHVVLPRSGPSVPRYQALGAKVHYAPLTVLRRRMGLLDVLLLVPRLIRGALAVAKIARREQIQVIHTNMEVVLDGGVVAALLRLRHVLHYRGNTLDRPKLVFDLLTRWWVATAQHVFCISRSTAQIFLKRGLGKKVEALYNAVDVDRFAGADRRVDVRAALGASVGDVLVGTVGRIHPRKDVATFLRAGARLSRGLSRLRLVVVGTAEATEETRYHHEMEALAANLGISGSLCWAGARRDMPEVIKALDLLLVTSRHEGFGRVVAEALAGGCPMVASREGAFPELLDGVAGTVLVAPADGDAFAAAAAELLASGAVPGIESADRFRPEAVARHVVGAYLSER